MPKFRRLMGITILGLASACSAQTDTPETTPQYDAELAIMMPPSAPYEADATATLIDRTGSDIGTAYFYQATDGIIMRLAVQGLTPGIHGMHFHAAGTCEDPQDGFMATGGHIMPLGKPHGYRHPEGPHAGNLPNLIVRADGTAVIELHTHLVTVSGGTAALLDENGSTLIIHENEDDHFTQPIGGAGGRVVCGVVTAP
ncbi:MAG: superoxide dismutase family protein [Pseudomonadota bacterium]